jgi:GAF domain-containing protein
VVDRGGVPTPSADPLAAISEIVGERSRAVLDRALAAARELLQLDVAYIAAFDGGDQVYVAVDGDTEAFALTTGGSLPLPETICARVVDGRAPELIPDARADASVRDLDVVRDGPIGAYVGVPVRFSDGSLYGTFCCVGRSRPSRLSERDLDFMRVIARVIATYLEREETFVRADRSRADVFARVTHDLRSPLTSIIGYAEMMQASGDTSDAATVVAEARRLNEMLNDLLTAQSAGAARAPEPFDLGELARAQLAAARGQSQHHTLRIELPPEDLRALGDPPAVASVLSNLLSNAIKYSPAGGAVTVAVAARGDTGRVSVIDEGIGISPEQSRGVFTRFFRARSDAAAGIPGTGLGLALAREAIEAQGGAMGFESSGGHGSTFWFELPLAKRA